MNAKRLGYQLAHACLTKRELFAAMAMQGMLSNVGAVRNHGKVDGIEIDLIAPGAVRCADTLLTELAKEQP